MKHTPLQRKKPIKRANPWVREKVRLDRALLKRQAAAKLNPNPLKRKKPLFRGHPLKPLFRGTMSTWKPFTTFKIVNLSNHGPIGSPLKPLKPLPKVSRKRAALNKLYAAAKREWRAQHPGFCEMRFEDPERTIHAPSLTLPPSGPSLPCRRRADRNPHHAAGRLGALLCDTRFWVALCLPCHNWCHQNAKEAARLGYIIRNPAK